MGFVLNVSFEHILIRIGDVEMWVHNAKHGVNKLGNVQVALEDIICKKDIVWDDWFSLLLWL